jgi:hypothetical protein
MVVSPQGQKAPDAVFGRGFNSRRLHQKAHDETLSRLRRSLSEAVSFSVGASRIRRAGTRMELATRG